VVSTSNSILRAVLGWLVASRRASGTTGQDGRRIGFKPRMLPAALQLHFVCTEPIVGTLNQLVWRVVGVQFGYSNAHSRSNFRRSCKSGVRPKLFGR
jgi:hypothetical protein